MSPLITVSHGWFFIVYKLSIKALKCKICKQFQIYSLFDNHTPFLQLWRKQNRSLRTAVRILFPRWIGGVALPDITTFPVNFTALGNSIKLRIPRQLRGKNRKKKSGLTTAVSCPTLPRHTCTSTSYGRERDSWFCSKTWSTICSIIYSKNSSFKFSSCINTGLGRWLWTWVGLTLISIFHHYTCSLGGIWAQTSVPN